jgi:hypothetical protein
MTRRVFSRFNAAIMADHGARIERTAVVQPDPHTDTRLRAPVATDDRGVISWQPTEPPLSAPQTRNA